MEAVMPLNRFMELTEDNLIAVDGGVNYYEVGLSALGDIVAIETLAAAPEITIPVVAAYYFGLGTSWDLLYHGLKD
ncbi:hypothetical protein ACETAC_05930 [Aceticella autotrophica]|uniref:Uncharacterized protein n=1 Tax=Aceticella autotrophica TaxID=2755338 RepID=A0A974Y2M0_9THEO|nr:hypothetical protein [Aceticella autotrophica]QSZ26464.1 hypothetical protein ACETAC_05930 [Aceticella autotrophica]